MPSNGPSVFGLFPRTCWWAMRALFVLTLLFLIYWAHSMFITNLPANWFFQYSNQTWNLNVGMDNNFKILFHDENSSICPSVEANSALQGRLNVSALASVNATEASVAAAHGDLGPGGSWSPPNCTTKHKVAFVIPYRDRQRHLAILLNYLIPILKRQSIDFRFIVTEQAGFDVFNKGRIMNAAFRFIAQNWAFHADCLIFHDVDMLPEDDRVPYSCPVDGRPLHLGAYVNSLGYNLMYNILTGGVLAMRLEDFVRVNGYSNMYWGWGGEDDDMGIRILERQMAIDRPNKEVVRYQMVEHKKRGRGLREHVVRQLVDQAKGRMDRDGLNEADKWQIVKVEVRPLYFHLLVDVGEPPAEVKKLMRKTQKADSVE